MIALVEAVVLMEAVESACRTLEKRPANPVLSGVLLWAGDRLAVESVSSQGIRYRALVPAVVREQGDLIAPARMLRTALRFAHGHVLEIFGEDTDLVLRDPEGGLLLRLPMLAAAEWPVPQERITTSTTSERESV